MTNNEKTAPRSLRTPVATPLGNRYAAAIGLGLLAVTLGACGGGGGGTAGDGSGGGGPLGPSSAYAAKCAPDNTLARDGSGNLFSRYVSGTLDDEKSWVRNYMDEAYLWYKEVPAVDTTLAAFSVSPAQDALKAWFDALKTPALTAAGARKDEFSFTMPTAQWNALAQTGVVGGYGIEWIVVSPTPPRNVRVAYVEDQSQAGVAGVARGDAVLSVVIDGATIDFVNTTSPAEIEKLNEALFSPPAGRRVTFRLLSNNNVERVADLTASQLTTTPVKQSRVLDVGGAKVGYLLFNDFILPGENQLKAAIQNFQAAAVSDLVLDLRYNGGGYLYMASQLAYMIAPLAKTAGKTFERSMYSDKRAAATASPSSSMQFMNVSSGISGSNTVAGSPLPNLALNRVYVLTTPGTCSASESVINGLRGVDVEVIVLGANTCGKPYGFTARDNCGLSYFPVEFQGVNEKGFGDFPDGFAPTCAVADDLSRPLGDESEGLLAAALAYRVGGSCAAVAAGKPVLKADGAAGAAAALGPGTIVRPASRSNKFLAP